jgi:hypothetical protein
LPAADKSTGDQDRGLAPGVLRINLRTVALPSYIGCVGFVDGLWDYGNLILTPLGASSPRRRRVPPFVLFHLPPVTSHLLSSSTNIGSPCSRTTTCEHSCCVNPAAPPYAVLERHRSRHRSASPHPRRLAPSPPPDRPRNLPHSCHLRLLTPWPTTPSNRAAMPRNSPSR